MILQDGEALRGNEATLPSKLPATSNPRTIWHDVSAEAGARAKMISPRVQSIVAMVRSDIDISVANLL